MKIRRYTRLEVRECKPGAPVLPQSFSRLEFVAATEGVIDRKRRWILEVPVDVLERLLKSRVDANRTKKRAQALTTTSKDLRAKVEDLTQKLERLEKNNDRLMKNIEADRRPDKFQRSPKNYLNVMEERSMKVKGLPLQGGLAGIEKK